jgi:diguanylate cyclase (GGDEF)-like protein
MGAGDAWQESINEAQAAQPGDDADPAETAALKLGVPEWEFTPRVRAALAALAGEVARLKREVVSARKRAADAEHAASQDTLLPVLNRRAFMHELKRFIALAERYGTPASLLYFDLDGFKAVNDAHGHAAGDAVLQHFAGLLANHVRGTDIVGRLGGDEFGIVLAHAGLEQARRKGEELAAALRTNPPLWQDKPVQLSFSYGTHELRLGESADIAIANADQAMYGQKRKR